MEASPAFQWLGAISEAQGGREVFFFRRGVCSSHPSRLPPSSSASLPSVAPEYSRRLPPFVPTDSSPSYFSLRLSVSLSDNNLYFPSCQRNPLKRPNPAERFQLPSRLSAPSPVAPAGDMRRCLHQMRSFKTVCSKENTRFSRSQTVLTFIELICWGLLSGAD